MPSRFTRTMVIMPALILMAVLSTGSFAEDAVIKGYLMDVACSTRNTRRPVYAPAHSRGCLKMPSCSDSGYGVLTEDKKFIKFDADGNEKARKLLEDAARNDDFKVTVSGSVDGEKMTVSRIELQ